MPNNQASIDTPFPQRDLHARSSDVALVSCNHERTLVAGLWPTLATSDVHPQRIGRLAVEQLARRIAGQFADVAVQITVPPTFVPGGSLGRGLRRGSS